MKLSSSPKDLTMVSPDGPGDVCCIFEGFMDMLSYMMLKRMSVGKADLLVLNSVSNVGKAIPVIGRYNCVYCFLDNDTAGGNAYAVFGSSGVSAVDMSPLYFPCKDLNEYLCKCWLAEHVNSKIR